jgi:CDP-paratose 2-epimerase
MTGKPVLITGGAGFIGSNLAHRLLSAGQSVILFDNLSRNGVDQNLSWLHRTYGSLVQFIPGDVRDPAALKRAVQRAGQVFHFAAQVAVTSSLTDVRTDFDVNTVGTFNLLEQLRALPEPPPLIFTSTNKVYGRLDDIQLQKTSTRYQPEDPHIPESGIAEDRHLDFHTPYGCSKGAAEQYVLDYARSFGRPAAVFRMSCIYGPRQFGTEDQGWVAHFLIQALEDHPITIYGDGLQVRDILFVDDLVDAFLLAGKNMDSISGQAFNIGGGPTRAVSLLDLLSIINKIHGTKPHIRHEDARKGDQRYYVSDTGKFHRATGWTPKVSAADGIQQLHDWLAEARHLVPEAAEV